MAAPDPVTPWQRELLAARNPYMARNAFGITTWISVDESAPHGAQYGGPYELIAGSGVSFVFGTQLFGTVLRKTLTLTAAGGGGVSSINTMTGAVTITAGTGINVANAGTTITISSTVSTAGLAPINNPVFTGDPQAPTPATGDNDTSIATTAFVKAQGYATTASLGSYVLKAGDTMSGDLTISKASPTLNLVKPASGTAARIFGSTGANSRWQVNLGDSAAESGGNSGSDFTINRYNDAGTFLDAPISVTRSTGVVTANCPVFTSSLKGFAPASGGGTANFLRADGSWTAPPTGSGITTCTITRYLSGSGTHTPGGSTKFMRVRLIGGGGGGGAGGTVSTAALDGGNTTFGALIAGGGVRGPGAGGGNGGAGGTASGGNVNNIPGNAGGPFIYLSAVSNTIGGSGGANPFGGGGTTGGLYGNGTGSTTGTGAGGGGGGATGSVNGGSGGGSGGCVEHVYTTLAGSYSYALGLAGGGGVGTTNGGSGGSGLIIIEEYS